MASKYRRGKRIRTISEFEESTNQNNQKMFWIQSYPTHIIRHIGWIESYPYRTLKLFIDQGMVYEAILKSDKDDAEE